MINEIGAESSTRGQAVFVTVTEGLTVQMETAFIAGAFRKAGFSLTRVATDFCTDADAFQATLVAAGGSVIVFPYVPEFREIVRHLSGMAATVKGASVLVLGEGLRRETHPPALDERVRAVASDPGSALAALLANDALPAPDFGEVPAALDLFGTDLASNPMTGSLFAEVGVVPLLSTRESPASLSPTALLARLQAPVHGGPIVLPIDTALAPLTGQSSLPDRVAWWDRDATAATLSAAAAVKELGVAHQDARVLVEGRSVASLAALVEAGIDRVVFEIDRMSGTPHRKGGGDDALAVLPFAREAKRLGMEVSVLLVIGMPGETRALARARQRDVAALTPDRLRCVAYEPTIGHPITQAFVRDGILNPGQREWNRELHRPVVTDQFGVEDFIQSFSEGLMLLAEVEARRARSR